MRTIAALLCVIFLSTTSISRADEPQNPHWPQKWNYVRAPLASDKDADHLIDLLKQSSAAGCTHIALGAGGMGRVDLLTNPAYIKRAEKVRAAADELHLALVPMVFSIGYGGETLRHDGNLLAGLRVEQMPFIINGNTGDLDPSAVPQIKNPGLETPDGWNALPPNMTFDTAEKHSGNASLKINIPGGGKPGGWEDDERILRPAGTTLNQTIPVKPFQYFKISYWAKASQTPVNYYLLTITGRNGQSLRKLTQWHLPLTPEQHAAKDWIQINYYIDTLDSNEMILQFGPRIGDRAGTIWIDDVEIQPAGLMLALHRDTAPLVVTSQDGKTTYAEGKDYEPIIDSAIDKFPSVGELDTTHAAPKLKLTPQSAIKDGQTVLISFYNAMRINDDQDVVTMQDPRVLQIYDDNIKALVKVWPGAGYFMSGYDEIRITGWEPNPGGETLTPGQILSRHTKAAYQIIKKYSPNASVYLWEDMYSPYHNAKPGVYFLCNGNYDKSWEGLPQDLIIMNWYAPTRDALSFFSDHGFHQVLCGYYDATNTAQLQTGLKNWFEKSAGLKNIDGMMYTTWTNNYSFMKEFFQLVDTYPAWATAEK